MNQSRNTDQMMCIDKEVLERAKNVCSSPLFQLPRLFLVKQLYRRYGTDCIHSLNENEDLQWVIPEELRSQVQSADNFVVCGDMYRKLKSAFADTTIKGVFLDSVINKYLQDDRENIKITDRRREVILLLSLYHEVTLLHISQDEVKQKLISNGKYVKDLLDFIQSNPLFTHKDFAISLAQNTFGTDAFTGRTGTSPMSRTLEALVVHVMSTLKSSPRTNLLQPLADLMDCPEKMGAVYLPTMHEDILLETMDALKDRVRWYRCPNGHPYAIGDCGMAWEEAKCYQCGAKVGGSGHRLQEDNVDAMREDSSKIGHILGSPDSRINEEPFPQRDMFPLPTAIVRLIVHACMIGAYFQSKKDVAKLIHPTLKGNEDIFPFLWKHLECDLLLTSKASGRSVDDAALTVHMVLDSISNQPNGGDFNDSLDRKEGRRKWENEFTASYINPITNHISDKLQEAYAQLQVDAKQFHRMLHELDCVSEDIDSSTVSVYNIRPLWRYRSKISIQHLSHVFNEVMVCRGEDDECELLRQFLMIEYRLRAVRYLPDIIQLQQLLIDHFHRRIGMKEAETLKIGQYLRMLSRERRSKMKPLLSSFNNAWNLVKNDIANCGVYNIEREYCHHDVEDDTSISMVLPASKGPGNCSTSLVDFLITTQNEFLSTYERLTDTKLSVNTVEPTLLTPANIIAYDTDKDLLPVVMANCSYTLRAGEGTVVDYDMPGIERQIADLFLKSKKKIKKKLLKFEFRQDSRDAEVFRSLKMKIKQEQLTKSVRIYILRNFKQSQLADINDSIETLEIAIGFVASSGGKPDMTIKAYITDILKMESSALQVKHQSCLKHIISLWKLLTVERAKRLMANSQDPFESLDLEYKEKMDEEMTKRLRTSLQEIDTCALTEALYQYIVIQLEKQSDGEDSHKPDWGLVDVLPPFLDQNDESEIKGFEKNFPDDILLKNVWHTLKAVLNFMQDQSSPQ